MDVIIFFNLILYQKLINLILLSPFSSSFLYFYNNDKLKDFKMRINNWLIWNFHYNFLHILGKKSTQKILNYKITWRLWTSSSSIAEKVQKQVQT